MLHPGVAFRSCSDCQRYHYHDKPSQGVFGAVMERAGRKVERALRMQPTPCRWCPKIARGDPPRPTSAQELSERNAAAFLHYRRCKAVGRFPSDPIVERNAAFILQVEDEAHQDRDRVHQLEQLTMILASGRK